MQERVVDGYINETAKMLEGIIKKKGFEIAMTSRNMSNDTYNKKRVDFHLETIKWYDRYNSKILDYTPKIFFFIEQSNNQIKRKVMKREEVALEIVAGYTTKQGTESTSNAGTSNSVAMFNHFLKEIENTYKAIIVDNIARN